MKFRSEKGFTVTDIAIAIIVLFIFVSIIAFLIYNYNSDMKATEYESKAAKYAIDVIEDIKKQGVKNLGNEVEETIYDKEPLEDPGFSKTVKIEDYKKTHQDKQSGILQKVTVTISYNYKGEQNVTLSTIITKENV